MTTIIFLEQSLILPDVYDATNVLVNYHVQATQARFAWELEERIAEGKPVKLATSMIGHWPYNAYQAAIARIEAAYPAWSVYDDRVLLFLKDLTVLVKDARFIWVDLAKSHTDYEKSLHNLIKKAFDGFSGAKLHLQKDDPAQAIEFVRGKVTDQ